MSNTTLQLNAQTFDRLVDGELSTEEYRQVLLALDLEPQAWRQCAEAFLEAQAWRRDFVAVRTVPVRKVPESTAVPAKRHVLEQDWLRMLLVAAASFLLAFVGAQSYWRVTVNALVVPQVPQVVHAPVAPADSPQAPKSVSYRPVSSVNLAVNREGQEDSQMLQVPVFDPNAANALLSNSLPALPDDLLESLTAEGHQVDRQRKLVPVLLDDGRQMMLPVEGYRIVPVSRPTY